MENNSLEHHGIMGMKWGVRRYQKKDGSLTTAGKKRYDKEMAKIRAEEQKLANQAKTKAKFAKLDSKRKALDEKKRALSADDKKAASKPKGAKDMTDEELTKAIRRSELEKRYNDLNPQKVSFGKKFVDQAVVPGAINAGKSLLQDGLIKLGKKALGLDSVDADQEYIDRLQKHVKKLTLEDKLETLNNKAKEKQASKSNDEATESPKKNSADDSAEKFTGRVDVSGSGSSKKSNASKGRSWVNDTVIDAEWREVPSSSSSNNNYTKLGESYVSGLLPEKIRR